jgi:antitoxin CptB
MQTNLSDNPAHLKWACRRGMLELDVLLGNFLNEAYPSLASEDKQHFISLLSCPDPELFVWLMGGQVPEDPHLAKIVEVIRHHVRTRF